MLEILQLCLIPWKVARPIINALLPMILQSVFIPSENRGIKHPLHPRLQWKCCITRNAVLLTVDEHNVLERALRDW